MTMCEAVSEKLRSSQVLAFCAPDGPSIISVINDRSVGSLLTQLRDENVPLEDLCFCVVVFALGYLGEPPSEKAQEAFKLLLSVKNENIVEVLRRFEQINGLLGSCVPLQQVDKRKLLMHIRTSPDWESQLQEEYILAEKETRSNHANNR